MLDIYGTLEIQKILDEVASFSHSELAKEKILHLKMHSSFASLKKDLIILDEMMSVILRHGVLPINVSFDISKYVDMAKKGGVLTPLDLDHVANDVLIVVALFDYFRKVEHNLYPNLIDLTNNLIDVSTLEKDIHQVITPNLTIYDNASKELSTIRRNIMQKEASIRSMTGALVNKYKDYLSDTSISIRNDHFVLAVKSVDKNKVNGVIHDVSDSGQTTFIEPNVLVDLSNEIYLLHKKEKEEINRLLKELSLRVVDKSSEIISNNKIIAELDFISSKANYGNEHKSFVSILEEKPIIDIKEARHPLIDSNKVIANDFHLDEQQRLIIISGPNAGGKTVALKTLGLMVMMNQLGLALPVSTPATLSFFPKIYADIGDNQSLSDNLSTFAAHVSNLSTITYFVTKNDLVLLDELGTGTSPNEGEAIALSISDFLLEKQCFGIISSHFEEMKEYAYRHEGVINAMMAFDDKKLLPTYSLKVGYPGRSYGLEMAKRYHLKDSVIENAKTYLNKSKKRSVNDVLDKLNKVLRENELTSDNLKKRLKDLENKEKDNAYLSKQLEKKKQSLLEDVTKEKEAMIEKAQEEITNILRVLSNPNSKQVDLIEARKNLEKMKDNLIIEEDKDDEEIIKLNDYVETDLGFIGKVISIKGNKVELTSPDGMNIKTTIDRLHHSDKPIQRRVMPSNIDNMLNLKTDVKLELNIIGEHVDEGLIKVSKYLDDARVKHFAQVRIIHGMGTGALRKAVHEYLAKCDFIKEYHYGGTYDGGTGATIVIFK